MSEQEERRRIGDRRNRRKRLPLKPQVILKDPDVPAPSQRVAEMGIEPSRERERPKYKPTEENSKVVEAVVTEVLKATGVPFELSFEHGAYHRVGVSVEGGAAGALIGRRGASIEALELLIGRMASHQVGALLPLQLDVNEYRSRQEDDLRQAAADAAQRVLQTGADHHFAPMNGRERRIVHITVKPTEGLETFTVGEGSDRHVVICKLGEDAREEKQ